MHLYSTGEWVSCMPNIAYLTVYYNPAISKNIMETNIGGSLLPSSSYDTYDLVRIGQGVGGVVRSEDADTHIAMVEGAMNQK